MTYALHRIALLALMGAAALAVLTGAYKNFLSATAHSEYEVKAAYLFNFGRFVEWPSDVPASRANEFTICVLGRDPFGISLDSTVAGENIEGKTVVVRRISKVSDATQCHVLFISASEDRQLHQILSTLGKLSILTVSDIANFLQQGGMVEFLIAGQRIRFSVNLAAVREAHLNLSSELLKVAAEVRGNLRAGD
jgi:hypothetical protein